MPDSGRRFVERLLGAIMLAEGVPIKGDLRDSDVGYNSMGVCVVIVVDG